MADPIETSELLAFARTVDAKSLSRAASELGVPRATIGRRLARLEERLGTRLLRRTTRTLVLTDAGVAFYRHARIVLDAVTQAEQSVRRTDDRIRGELRLSLPPGNNVSLGDLLCRFATLHPEVKLHVHTGTQLVDLQRDGYDVALRATMELAPGLMARTLDRMPLLAVASPAYLARAGTPRSARDLRAHRCLLGFARGELPQTHWPLVGGGRVRVEGVFTSNAVELLAQAALEGLGIALLPGLLIEEHLARGTLVHVLPTVGIETRFSVVWVEREFVSPAVRAFVDAVAEWAADGLRGSAVRPPSPSERPAPRRARPRAPRSGR